MRESEERFRFYVLRACFLLFALPLCGSQLSASSPEVLRLAKAPAQKTSSSVLSEPTPLLPATAPSPVPGVVAEIFSVLPGSFRTDASNAAVDWNIVRFFVPLSIQAKTLGCP